MQNQIGKYFYLDKNGYVLNISLSAISDMPQIKGITEGLENQEIGGRIDEKEFEKFNDLIKIVSAMENNSVTAKLNSIDISDKNNYILEFTEENKIVMLGDISELSTKMAWVKLFIENYKDISGTVHLNAKDVYFTPST